MMQVNFDKGAGLVIPLGDIPRDLHDVVPLVEKWAFSEQPLQDRFASLMLKNRPEEVVRFNDVIDEYRLRIIEWGRTLQSLDKHVDEMTDDDFAHPYWHFINALKIRELTGHGSHVSKSAIEARQRFTQENRTLNFSEATSRADLFFRDRNYQAYVDLMSPYEDLFTNSQMKKFRLAKSRLP